MNSSLRIMEIIQEVSPNNGWNMVMKLVKEMDTIDILCKEWHDSFKEKHPDMYPLDLTNIKTWSTFSECVSMKFTLIDDNSLLCKVTIWDGDRAYGNREERRFTTELRVPISFLDSLKNEVSNAYRCHLERLYDQHLRQQKKDWIKETSQYLLTGM